VTPFCSFLNICGLSPSVPPLGCVCPSPSHWFIQRSPTTVLPHQFLLFPCVCVHVFQDHMPISTVLSLYGRELLTVFPDLKLHEMLALFRGGKSHLAIVHDVVDPGEVGVQNHVDISLSMGGWGVMGYIYIYNRNTPSLSVCVSLCWRGVIFSLKSGVFSWVCFSLCSYTHTLSLSLSLSVTHHVFLGTFCPIWCSFSLSIQ